MSRRRIMMAQLIKNAVDYLEGYRLSYRSTYKIESVWQNNNTLTLKHTSAGFMGARSAYQCFFGASQSQSTGISAALTANIPLPTVDTSRCYRLTLTVLSVNSNSATDESSGDLEIAIGRAGRYQLVSTPFCDIAVGTKIVVETPEPSYTICAGVFGSNNANTIWDFDFDVKLEEV